jgi:HEAT repeat protein
MRAFSWIALAVLLSGCARPAPMLAGGKPVAHWVEALKDPDPGVRKTAAFKLGNVGPADAAACPALLAALQDRDPQVRCEVILALLKCGREANDAIPTLRQVRQYDWDARVRDYATRALAKLESRSTPTDSHTP